MCLVTGSEPSVDNGGEGSALKVFFTPLSLSFLLTLIATIGWIGEKRSNLNFKIKFKFVLLIESFN